MKAPYMIGNKHILTNLQPCNLECVKGTLLGSGQLNALSLPKLENVILLDGLKPNLITSINFVIRIYLLNLPKLSGQSLIALMFTSWKEKDYLITVICLNP